MGAEHDAAATLSPEPAMYPYMEAPHPAYPPAYDEPETTKTEVLDVVFGRRHRDGLGRDFDDLMSETSLMLWSERISSDPDAERELMGLINLHGKLTKAHINELAEIAVTS